MHPCIECSPLRGMAGATHDAYTTCMIVLGRHCCAASCRVYSKAEDCFKLLRCCQHHMLKDDNVLNEMVHYNSRADAMTGVLPG